MYIYIVIYTLIITSYRVGLKLADDSCISTTSNINGAFLRYFWYQCRISAQYSSCTERRTRKLWVCMKV